MSEWISVEERLPEREGYYWVWGRPRIWNDKRETRPVMFCVEVVVGQEGSMWFDPHLSAHDWRWDLDSEDVEYWMGPIEKPTPPEATNE